MSCCATAATSVTRCPRVCHCGLREAQRATVALDLRSGRCSGLVRHLQATVAVDRRTGRCSGATIRHSPGHGIESADLYVRLPLVRLNTRHSTRTVPQHYQCRASAEPVHIAVLLEATSLNAAQAEDDWSTSTVPVQRPCCTVEVPAWYQDSVAGHCRCSASAEPAQHHCSCTVVLL